MDPSSALLRPGRTCWAVPPVDECGVIIDARAYYRAVHRAIAQARRYVLMMGWQFDTDVELLRGAEAWRADAPRELLALLEWACRRNPELEIYMLPWRFSPVYLLERRWLQRARFTRGKIPRIHFEWDRWHRTGASAHQKLVAIDGAIAFAGGMDVCSGRWDGPDHQPDNPLRRSRSGALEKPYHDVQAFVRGGAVRELERLFCERWRRNTGQLLALPDVAVEAPSLTELTDGEAIGVRARHVALSQTNLPPDDGDAPAAHEVRSLYLDAIAGAEKLVYMENQYFTSRALTRAFLWRLSQKDRARIQLVLIMPRGGDSPKEKLALGDAQASALLAIRRMAEDNGHSFRLLYPASRGSNGQPQPTFIHSKLLVVDDRLLSVGSANATNRSFGLDSELNLSWESDGPELSADIARVRATLLAEHCGRAELEPFLELEGLSQRLDHACVADARLHAIELEPVDDADPLLSLVTDPEGPLRPDVIGDRLEEIWEADDAGWLEAGVAWLGARFTRKKRSRRLDDRSQDSPASAPPAPGTHH
jgi:phospholipase D1/2